MTEEKRPTLTLRRKSTAADSTTISSVPSGERAPVVTRSRKQTVVVSSPPAWKVRKESQVVQEREARQAEKARLKAEQLAEERIARETAARKSAPLPVYMTRMPLNEALNLLERCWPSLVVSGKPQLLAINIRPSMLEDIRERELGVSGKQLKMCLSAVTRSDVYLDAMIPGALRMNIDGQPTAVISESEAEFARGRKIAEHLRLERKQHVEEEQARNIPDTH